MIQQNTEQDAMTSLPVDDDGYLVDTHDAQEREEAWRGRGTSRPITVVGNPVLHRECEDVTDFGEDLRQLVADMFASQRTARGVGLAANQIGVGLKVFVYDCPDDKGVRHVGAVCNPRLVDTPRDTRTEEGSEGCLSVPGPYARLERAYRAEVAGQDLGGNPVKVRGTGFFARCLQHETDHLNGRLYIDRLSAEAREDVLRQMAENEPAFPVVPND
ncbi:peptide deformylase [Streptomyces tendae]